MTIVYNTRSENISHPVIEMFSSAGVEMYSDYLECVLPDAYTRKRCLFYYDYETCQLDKIRYEFEEFYISIYYI